MGNKKTAVDIEYDLRNIMKEDVYTLKADENLYDALEFLVTMKISGAPIVSDSGALVGFISDGDILKFLTKLHPLYESPYSIAFVSPGEEFDHRLADLMKLKVGDVAMYKEYTNIYTVDVNSSLEKVCQLLHQYHLKKLPVTENDRMVGIINRSDVMEFIVQRSANLIK